MLKSSVHLVGSIPLGSSEAVFDLIGRYLKSSCKRVPDGETGDRRNWIGWQYNIFAKQEPLVQCRNKERDYQLGPPFTFARGRSSEGINFNNLGFAHNAIKSYELFEKKKKAGTLSMETKFLVALPTAFAPVYSFISYEAQDAIYPLYEKAILNEIDQIFEHVRLDNIAIQWDVATEMSIFEKVFPVTFKDEWEILIGRLTKIGNAVPLEAELGYHFCYGSMSNKHWKEPDDLSLCMLVFNELSRRLGREINFIHMPVPINRVDKDYYKPLQKWNSKPGQDIFLGSIHLDDGLEGNLARLKTASRYLENYGISTECGLGRREPAMIPEWMKLMSKLALKL